jgi:hypothetical protein
MTPAVSEDGLVEWRDADMAWHWIDRYAAGIDDEPQLDRILDCVKPTAAISTLAPSAAPQEGEGDYFLTAYVSKDGRTVGIDHPTEADWNDVLTAHVGLRDRLNERIAEQEKCPFKPALASPSAEAAQPVATALIQSALDLLQEKKYGHPARSPGHNAQLELKAALSALSVPASPSAEAAQPVAENVAYFISDKWGGYWQTVRDGKPYNFRQSPAQPQGELREALDALHFVSKDPAYSVLRNTTRGFVDAALARRTAG